MESLDSPKAKGSKAWQRFEFMEIDQLRHFVAVAELGNFTHAARQVGLSQSALSRSMAKFEEELGQPLFERQSRGVSLTDAGKLLFPKAKQILTLAAEAKSEISDDGQTGRIRVGAIPTILPYYLPPLLRQFSDRYPAAKVMVREETTEGLLKAITDGELDLAIMALPLSAKYLDIDELFEEELMLVLPADSPLASKKQIRLSDIESMPFVLLNEAHCLTDNIVSFCRHRAFDPEAVERTSQLATVQELVSLHHGISMVPAMAAELDSSPRRVYRSLVGVKPTRKIAVVSNPYRFKSKLLQAFRRLL